eukprot:3814705-Amphidinium_carterae.1
MSFIEVCPRMCMQTALNQLNQEDMLAYLINCLVDSVDHRFWHHVLTSCQRFWCLCCAITLEPASEKCQSDQEHAGQIE